jgi:hypothetical protein
VEIRYIIRYIGGNDTFLVYDEWRTAVLLRTAPTALSFELLITLYPTCDADDGCSVFNLGRTSAVLLLILLSPATSSIFNW